MQIPAANLLKKEVFEIDHNTLCQQILTQINEKLLIF